MLDGFTNESCAAGDKDDCRHGSSRPSVYLILSIMLDLQLITNQVYGLAEEDRLVREALDVINEGLDYCG